MPDEDGNATSLEILADYECPECGILDDPDGPTLTEDEAMAILGGDDDGFLRCPNDWCDEELEPTAAAALDMLNLVAERMAAPAPEPPHSDSSTAQPQNERIEDDAWDGVPDHLRGSEQ